MFPHLQTKLEYELLSRKKNLSVKKWPIQYFEFFKMKFGNGPIPARLKNTPCFPNEAISFKNNDNIVNDKTKKKEKKNVTV